MPTRLPPRAHHRPVLHPINENDIELGALPLPTSLTTQPPRHLRALNLDLNSLVDVPLSPLPPNPWTPPIHQPRRRRLTYRLLPGMRNGIYQINEFCGVCYLLLLTVLVIVVAGGSTAAALWFGGKLDFLKSGSRLGKLLGGGL